jgi:hypothetical protein
VALQLIPALVSYTFPAEFSALSMPFGSLGLLIAGLVSLLSAGVFHTSP